MNYVKSCLIVTMLLGVGYSECNTNIWNCDCNEDTWQDYYNSEGHNMEGCYLVGANLTEAYLEGAYLQEANLSNADLSYAFLVEAYLQEANLTGANLSWANLTEAYLQEANLTVANLTEAYLEGANLEGANLCNLAGSPSGDVCEQPEGIIDSNGDGYDDGSYEAGATSGDLNLDETTNILDVVALVNIILNP